MNVIDHLKNEARKIKKIAPDLKHSQALELAARNAGYRTYAAARAANPQDK